MKRNSQVLNIPQGQQLNRDQWQCVCTPDGPDMQWGPHTPNSLSTKGMRQHPTMCLLCVHKEISFAFRDIIVGIISGKEPKMLTCLLSVSIIKYCYIKDDNTGGIR